MVSIIIPLYNVEKYIHDSLKSAMKQSFENIEIILVNDCSTDKTLEVASQLVEQSPIKEKVRIISQDINKGASAARNLGIEQAKGEYIFFMDADDEITKDCIKLHYEALVSSDADFSIANMKIIGARSIHSRFINCEEISTHTPLESFLSRQWIWSPWNKLYRKDFLKKKNIKFKEGLRYSEDTLWSYFTSKSALKIQPIDDITYLYKIRPNSTTTRKVDKTKIDSANYIISTLSNDWSNLNESIKEKYSSLFNKYLDQEILYAALLLLRYTGNYREKRHFFRTFLKYAPNINKNIYSLSIHMPFFVFYTLLKPLYLLYKRMTNI